MASSSADRSSPESAEWISASPGPDGGTPSSPRSSPSAEPCSPSDSPASPSTPTSATSPSAGAASRGGEPAQAMTWDALNHTASHLSPTMGTNTGSSTGRAGVVWTSPSAEAASRGESPVSVWTLTGDYADPMLKETDRPMVTANPMSDRIPFVGPASTSSPSEAPVRTSPSPGSDEDSTATAPASSGKQCESPEMALFDPEPYSWKTSKGSCLATVDGTSRSSWTRWPSAGIGGASGFSTRSTSASPSVDGESSWSQSLTTILEPNASERYSLSPKAAAGILRRASRRGRTLPPALEQALRAVAETAR